MPEEFATKYRKTAFAVVGCGHIGKRHAEMIARHPEAEVVALIDIRAKEALQLQPEIDKTPFFSSLEAFLASNIPCDVVNICTPNGLHVQQGLACLDKGLHVVVEKPMALHKTDAQKLIEKAMDSGKEIFPVMQNRYSPPSVWAKELVSSGRLGKIYLVQLNCFWNRDARYYKTGSWHGTKNLDGGTLFTQFSHFIDILYWLFGDIQNIQTRLQDFNHQHLTEFEDTGTVSFDFVKGGMGLISFSTTIYGQNMETGITIIAENGSIKIGGQYMDKVEYCHVKDYELPALPPTPPGNDYGGYKGSAQNHGRIINNVIDVLHGKATVTTKAEDGLKVVDIIERIYGAA
jgi:UDP-N-acetyl-2-amino-2-deoxyglucuronate dehydrogenase